MEVYLDNAATTRVCTEAADIAYKVMTECYGNPSSTHTKGREAKAYLDNARSQIAAALGCAVVSSRSAFLTDSTEIEPSFSGARYVTSKPRD